MRKEYTIFTVSRQPPSIDHNDPIAKSAIPEPVPDPAALALTAGDEELALRLSLTPSRGRSQVRMWPDIVLVLIDRDGVHEW